jgi:sec-independent protein translocase protein TatB
MELAELKKLQEEARDAAQSVKSSVEGAVSSVEAEVRSAGAGETTGASSGYSWEGAGESWQRSTFPRRYKPGLSVDDLAEEVVRLKRQLSLPDAGGGSRRKYAPRARLNRPRIRR